MLAICSFFDCLECNCFCPSLDFDIENDVNLIISVPITKIRLLKYTEKFTSKNYKFFR